MPSDARYGEVSVKSYFLSASIISGDCQNHFMLPNNSALGYQADIAGHGVRAALLSATVLRLLTPSFCSWQDGEILKATEVLERLNQRLLSQTEIPEYFTLLLAMIDPAKGLGTVCQAGHPSPALRKPDGTIEWVGDGGFPVGMFPDVEYESWTFDFPPGSKLIMISDGIVECPDEYGDILGADKLEELLHEGSRHESQGKLPLEKYLIEKLKHRIGDSGFPDDVSILSISRGYNSGRSGSGSHDPCG
jgi:sigma-B regulation protein RsbU (phosphoserine phosphatase)